MKRRITAEQLNELTDEQKENIREFWEQKEGDWYYLELTNHITKIGMIFEEEPIPKLALPLLSIGQMIEILRSKLFKIEIYNFDSKWRVIFWHAGPRKEFVADELADALFQAIKAVL